MSSCYCYCYYHKMLVRYTKFIRSNVRVCIRYNSNHSSNERQGFGSFHSDDIDILGSMTTNDYLSVYPDGYPPVYKNIKDIIDKRFVSSISSSSLAYGKDCKEKLFVLDESWTFINHGAFGGALEPLLYESNLWKYMCESQPLKFFDRNLLPMIEYSVRNMAQFINCPSNELVPLPNVTSGLNAVCNSISLSSSLKKGDTVMCFSITYGSTKKILNDLCIRTGATLKIVEIPLPTSKEDIIRIVSNEMTNNTKLVIIDQITSNTALNLPIKELSMISKNVGATVVIDAAHALFAHDVSIYKKYENSNDEIADYCDYWITNGHKWLCTPKGCAYMWISPRMSSSTRPIIISHGFTASNASLPFTDKKKLLSSFAWDGCRDYNALLTTSSALRLWSNVPGGIVGVRAYIINVLRDAVNLLIKEWDLKKEDFPGSSELRVNSTMCLIPLPNRINGIDTTKGNSDKEAFQLQEKLHHDYSIEVPIKCLHGRLYVRISAHIYNTLDDYTDLAHVVKNMR